MSVGHERSLAKGNKRRRVGERLRSQKSSLWGRSLPAEKTRRLIGRVMTSRLEQGFADMSPSEEGRGSEISLLVPYGETVRVFESFCDNTPHFEIHLTIGNGSMRLIFRRDLSETKWICDSLIGPAVPEEGRRGFWHRLEGRNKAKDWW